MNHPPIGYIESRHFKNDCLSPLDGRYYEKTTELRKYFSEGAYFKYRYYIEIDYLNQVYNFIYGYNPNIPKDINDHDIQIIQYFEKETHHDVKAIEYFIRSRIDSKYHNMIHFGLTSQDINSTATIIMLRDCIRNCILGYINRLIQKIGDLSTKWSDVEMMCRTHGQPATSSTMGEQLRVFTDRLSGINIYIVMHQYTAKMGGAVGNLKAHKTAFKYLNWDIFFEKFLFDNYAIIRQRHTTQVENFENMCLIFDYLKRMNSILIDFCRDVWQYTLLEYFKLKKEDSQIGSSTMPHKINPIDFENAEGNLIMANGVFEVLSRQLPLSRLQRDLSGSTLIRNIGTAMGYTVVAYKSILNGLDKLDINHIAIEGDLLKHPEIKMELVQCLLRKSNMVDPYNKIRKISNPFNLIKLNHLLMENKEFISQEIIYDIGKLMNINM